MALALGRRDVEELEEVEVVAVDVEESAGPVVEPELGPGQHLDQLLEGGDAGTVAAVLLHARQLAVHEAQHAGVARPKAHLLIEPPRAGIDSFLVVVFGGVGNLWGTLIGGLGLGIANKVMEPWAGAVLAKILVLVFIILFIQKRPRGLFPQKGRAAEG